MSNIVYGGREVWVNVDYKKKINLDNTIKQQCTKEIILTSR